MHNKYDEYYNGIDSKLNIYDSFLTEIELAIKTIIDSSGTEVTIINNNCEKIFPTIKFENTTLNGTFITSSPSVSLSESVTADNFVFDFENQIYTADGDNIINLLEFDNNERPYIPENDEITFNFSEEAIVEYYHYETVERERFVESFQINAEFIYNDSDTELIDTEYDFSLSRYKTNNLDLLENLKEGKTFRIKYRNVELEDYTEDYNYLLEAKVKDWDSGFSQMGDIITINIAGDAQNLI